MKKKCVIQHNSNGMPIAKYNSMSDAAREVGGQSSHISECANNIRNTHKGWRWSYGKH